MAQVCQEHLTAISELHRDLAGVAGLLAHTAPGVSDHNNGMSEKIRHCLTAVDGYLRVQVGEITDPACCEERQALVEVLGSGMLAALVGCLGALDFEAQKDAARLFSALLRLGAPIGMDAQIAAYVECNPEVVETLLEGLAMPDLALHCSQMLISCTKSAELAAALLREGAASKLIELVQHQNFDIASEAYSVLRGLLLSHKASTAKFVEANFDDFFGSFHTLLVLPRYVTQRQALKLLGMMLLDRSFKEVMFQYVKNERFLQIHMNLFRHNSKAMQIAAFHIFKVFAVMPQKPRRVQQILFRNKDKLLCLLDSFQSLGEQDAGLANDLQMTVRSLTQLEAPTRSPSACTP
eukprot:CAMPEP_0172685744 /NCGR_PEP_ID=MMETSP1074-20121228/20454_1 /TAXON_ID=2916 /ORGANISM="Ceratium fusus, Strain PA161109" /LENGTH=350 /DNA_ID=CAMNT_0013504941 /DNA_START=49 /DNA_END=1101 /DNA_ORIENTATION=-